MLRLRRPETIQREPLPVHTQEAVPSSPAVPTNAYVEERIGRYLAQVASRLGPLSGDVRAGIVREMRGHLDALRASYEELGDTPETAVEAALARFGEPAVIARRFRRAFTGSGYQKPWAAMKVALPIYGGAALLQFGLLVLFESLLRSGALGGQWGYLASLIFYAGVYVLPLTTGVAVGRRATVRPGMGSFYVLVLFALMGGIVAYLSSHWVFAFAGILFCFWMPLACLSATATRWLTERSARRMRA